MSDFKRITESLAQGTDPAMLCDTCPWDRNCLAPPSMTSGEVERELAEAKAKDEQERQQAGGKGGFPIGTLVATMMLNGRDTQAGCCPVLGLRLRSSNGRSIVDGLKASMQAWDDNR